MKTVITPLGNIGEKELSRAIFLELCQRECNCEISQSPEGYADTRIFVVHTLNSEIYDCIAASKCENGFLLCFDEEISPPENVNVIRRPISLKSFCDFLTKKPYRENKNAKLDLNFIGETLHINGSPVLLTKTELSLFKLLYENRGIPLTREELTNALWGDKTTNVLDVYIRYLRQKLEKYYDGKIIVTVRNKGYMLK